MYYIKDRSQEEFDMLNSGPRPAWRCLDIDHGAKVGAFPTTHRAFTNVHTYIIQYEHILQLLYITVWWCLYVVFVCVCVCMCVYQHALYIYTYLEHKACCVSSLDPHTSISRYRLDIGIHSGCCLLLWISHWNLQAWMNIYSYHTM